MASASSTSWRAVESDVNPALKSVTPARPVLSACTAVEGAGGLAGARFIWGEIPASAGMTNGKQEKPQPPLVLPKSNTIFSVEKGAYPP